MAVWTRSTKEWTRTVLKTVGLDEKDRPIKEWVDEPVTMHKSVAANVDGSEIGCYAETEQRLAGLERLHMFAA